MGEAAKDATVRALKALKAKRRAAATSSDTVTSTTSQSDDTCEERCVPSVARATPRKGGGEDDCIAIAATTSGSDVQMRMVERQKTIIVWQCLDCMAARPDDHSGCVPVRDESRCICGHRLKAHAKIEPGSIKPPRCLHPGCRCKGFFFILAEGGTILQRCFVPASIVFHPRAGPSAKASAGTDLTTGRLLFFRVCLSVSAWILRCRCKHKHTDHDPVTHACTKPGCGCSRFDSPFVCNCDHPWHRHKQTLVTKTLLVPAAVSGPDIAMTSSFLELTVAGDEDLRGWNAVKRGEDAP